MQPISPYDEIADYYDVEHRDFLDDAELYLQFIEAAGDPVLEFGCGTGRILTEIARAGYQVTGIDNSSSMLEVARRRLKRLGLESAVTLVEGSSEQLNLVPSETFGVVVIAIDTLLHARTREGQIAMLRNAWQALDPRGQLIVDVLHATPTRLLAMDGSLTLAGSWILSDGSRLDKITAQSIEVENQTIHTEIRYDLIGPSGAVERTATQFDLRWIAAGELLTMLQLVGFQDWRVYGSYDLDPLDSRSDRLIVAAEKTKTD